MNTQNTIDEIAKLKRALREAPTAIVKTKIKEKIETLNKVLKDSNATTKELAVMLVGAKSKINSLDAKEWKQTMKRLSTRSEYSFLKGMTKNQIKDDLKREAKPVGWRFKGRGNYRKPTKSEIIAGRKKGTVYSEKRPERSDVTHPAKLEKGGGVDNVKKIIDGDNVWYLTYIDSTHFFLSNSPDFKGNAYHIGQFRGRPFYDEVNQWLKSFNKSYAKGGGVDGFNLVYQKWSKMMGGNGVSGTIRTTPEMYYVATIDEKGNISFEDLESNTKSINKEEVKRLWDTKMIPDITPNRYGDVRDIYKKGGMMNVNEENREMVENNNIQIMHHVKELKEAISKAEHIPAWVVAKVYDATRSLSDITHYLDGTTKMEEGGNLIGNQHKLDMNKNGRLDAEDFKILRRKK